MSERHAVLGGSYGIGFAYAKWYAKRGAALLLVARSVDRLQSATEELLEHGAESVLPVTGDLLNAEFRRRVLSSAAQMRCHGVYVGGPSPPVGRLHDVTAEDLRRAATTVLEYPFDVLSWGRTSGLQPATRITIVSSSSATEALHDHDFFLSALLRRALDELIECCRPLLAAERIEIRVWRPGVVLTPLALEYAKSHWPRESLSGLGDRLALELGCKALTPDDYVDRHLGGDDVVNR